jgi:hypothetical protein
LAKSSFPSLKTPTVLSQQELGNPVGKAFANRVGVFANSLALLAKHAFPVVTLGKELFVECKKKKFDKPPSLPRIFPKHSAKRLFAKCFCFGTWTFR